MQGLYNCDLEEISIWQYRGHFSLPTIADADLWLANLNLSN
jgi:hypothetical protein